MGATVRPCVADLYYRPRLAVAVRPETVDETLARLHGGTAGTWHQKRYGRHRVNHDTARVAAELRRRGDLEGYGQWMRCLEDVSERGAVPGTDTRTLAQVLDGEEDSEEARFHASPCEATARVLLRKRAAERQASLDDDRVIAARYGIRL